MNIDKKMASCVKEVRAIANNDFDCSPSEAILEVAKKWELDAAEVLYLYKYFNVRS